MSHLLHRPSGRNLGLALAFVLGAVALALAVWPAVSEPETVVSSTSLEGIRLETVLGMVVSALPVDVQPNVSRQAAEQAALASVAHGPVLDAVFAGVATPTFNGPAWIVSLSPGDAEYFIVIVDAETGDSIMAVASGPDHGGPAVGHGPGL